MKLLIWFLHFLQRESLTISRSSSLRSLRGPGPKFLVIFTDFLFEANEPTPDPDIPSVSMRDVVPLSFLSFASSAAMASFRTLFANFMHFIQKQLSTEQ